MNTSRTTSRTRKLLFLAIAWTVSLAIMLCATELILRLTSDGWDKVNYMNVTRNRTIRFDVSGLYETSNPQVLYHRDRYGLRDDCASPADIDIMTVGGSTTDQRYVPFESTYQKVMEENLTRALGKKICVSNAGISGHSTFGHIKAFRDWFPLIPGLKPKIFILYVGINDSGFVENEAIDYDLNRHGQSFFLNHLEIVQLGRWFTSAIGNVSYLPANRKEANPTPDDYVRTEMTPGAAEGAAKNAEFFRGRLRKLLDEAAKYSAEAICVTHPHAMTMIKGGKKYGTRYMWHTADWHYNGLDYEYSLRLINDVMRQECGEERLVDLASQPFENSRFYDYVHTTPSGSQAIGHALSAWLLESDLKDRLTENGQSSGPSR